MRAMTTPQSGRRWEIVAFGVLFMLVSGYFSIGAVQSFVRQSRAARAYAPVEAQVTAAEIVERGGARTASGGSFVPVVTYRYRVGARPYDSQRLAWTRVGWTTRDAATAVLASFAVGATVTAYVDPGEPTHVVLDPTPPPVGGLVVAGALAAFGAAVCLVGLRGRRR